MAGRSFGWLIKGTELTILSEIPSGHSKTFLAASRRRADAERFGSRPGSDSASSGRDPG